MAVAAFWIALAAFLIAAGWGKTKTEQMRHENCPCADRERGDARPRASSGTFVPKARKNARFSKAERGRFHKKSAELRFTVYLDAKLQRAVEDVAGRSGRDDQDVVNRIVEKEVRLIHDLESGER